MCELMAVATPEPRPFSTLAGLATSLERYGVAGFGWGVAWLDGEGQVCCVRGLGRFAEEGATDDELGERRSTRFLVHLRRPSRLSTVQMADTQPFVDDGRGAFCHNGFLARAEELRPEFSHELEGRADSEVGWALFRRERGAGAGVPEALRAVDDAFGGSVNLGYLGSDGLLVAYARSATNATWRFALDGAAVAATALHSDDESLFDLVFGAATDARPVEPGTAEVVGAPTVAAVGHSGEGAGR
ncbi:MAG: class II glutamine amidotransferase [Acidimicrobiales bacterium]